MFFLLFCWQLLLAKYKGNWLVDAMFRLGLSCLKWNSLICWSRIGESFAFPQPRGNPKPDKIMIISAIRNIPGCGHEVHGGVGNGWFHSSWSNHMLCLCALLLLYSFHLRAPGNDLVWWQEKSVHPCVWQFHSVARTNAILLVLIVFVSELFSVSLFSLTQHNPKIIWRPWVTHKIFPKEFK